jgi:hypothetical protein
MLPTTVDLELAIRFQYAVDCGSCDNILLSVRMLRPLERTVQDILQHIHMAQVQALLELLCQKR